MKIWDELKKRRLEEREELRKIQMVEKIIQNSSNKLEEQRKTLKQQRKTLE